MTRGQTLIGKMSILFIVIMMSAEAFGGGADLSKLGTAGLLLVCFFGGLSLLILGAGAFFLGHTAAAKILVISGVVLELIFLWVYLA